MLCLHFYDFSFLDADLDLGFTECLFLLTSFLLVFLDGGLCDFLDFDRVSFAFKQIYFFIFFMVLLSFLHNFFALERWIGTYFD